MAALDFVKGESRRVPARGGMAVLWSEVICRGRLPKENGGPLLRNYYKLQDGSGRTWQQARAF